MQRLLLTGLAVFLFSTLSAQKVIYSEEIGWKGNDIELHTITDKWGQQHAMFLVSEDSIRGFLVDQNEIVTRQYRLIRLNKEKLLGGFIKEGKIFLFLEHRVPAGLRNYVLDMKTGGVSDNFVQFELKNEKILERMNGGDHFLYFTINRKTLEFITYDWQNQEGADTIRYHFNDQNIWNDIFVSAGLNGDISVTNVDEAGECEAKIAGNPNKLYLYQDSVFLLMNNNKGITRVFAFDTHNRQVRFRKIIHNKIEELNKKNLSYVDNSFLYNGKLFFVSASNERLVVQVLDFSSGKILKKFVTEINDTVSYKNTPILVSPQHGLFSTAGQTKELKKTKQLLSEMFNSSAAISATDDSAGIALTVGSYERIIQSGGGGGMWMPTGGGTGGPPTMAYYPTGGFTSSSWINTNFRMSIDKNTIKHIPGEMQKSINEKIEDYTGGLKIPPEAENLFMINGHYLYAYYDKKQRKLVISKF